MSNLLDKFAWHLMCSLVENNIIYMHILTLSNKIRLREGHHAENNKIE